MKKTTISISLFMIIGLLCLAGFGQAVEEGYPGFGTVGSDKALIDNTNDIYKSTGDGYEFTSTQVGWIDLVNVTFEQGTENYTITAILNDNYHSNATIQIDMEINGSAIGSNSIYSQYADFYVKVQEGDGSIQLMNSVGRYIPEGNMAIISGDQITWTFPIENITNLVFNTKLIPEWRVVVKSSGNAGTESYTDFFPNFSSTSSPTGDIPGFSLLIVSLISIVSIVLIMKKVRKSNT